MKKLIFFTLAALLVTSAAVSAAENDDLQAQVEAMQQRITQLEAQQNEQAVSQRNAELIRQMVSELASQAHYGADSGVTAGYDKRFFIKSADDQFRLEFDTLMQFRHSYLLTDDGSKTRTAEGLPANGAAAVDSSGNAFEVERARLKLQGHVKKDLHFMIQLEMDDDNNNNANLIDYKVWYSFMPELGVTVGKFKGAFSKQFSETSPAATMFTDRSLATTVFNIGRGTGAELFGALPLCDTNLYYRAGAYNGYRDNAQNPFTTNDNNPVLAARLKVPLLGATPDDFINESDLMYHENPVMLLGTSMAYANPTTEDSFAGQTDHSYNVMVKGSDGLGNNVSPGGEIVMFGADASYKCRGLSVTLEGFYQHVNLDNGEWIYTNQFGTARDAFGIDGTEYDNFGWYAQTGYFLVPKVFELVSRIGSVCVDNCNDSYEYAGGWNWYLYGQDLKLSMDLTYIDDLPMVNSGTNYYGVQNNSLFLVRTQLQFMF